MAVILAAVIPGLVKHPLGTSPATTGPAAQGPAAPGSNAPATSSYDLSYANGLIVGPGAQCCASSHGTWTAVASGGFPDFNGGALTSADPNAWYEWSLGRPAGGRAPLGPAQDPGVDTGLGRGLGPVHRDHDGGLGDQRLRLRRSGAGVPGLAGRVFGDGLIRRSAA